VTAEVAAQPGGGQRGQTQSPAEPVPAGQPGHEGARVQAERDGVGARVDQADPALLPRQRRPVVEPGRRGRHGADGADADQHGRGPVAGPRRVDHGGADPRTEGQHHGHRVQRVAEPDAVQDVSGTAAQHGLYAALHRIADLVEPVGKLQPIKHSTEVHVARMPGPGRPKPIGHPAKRGPSRRRYSGYTDAVRRASTSRSTAASYAPSPGEL
jgi:hypothetical protein